jgi:hypothetical protein
MITTAITKADSSAVSSHYHRRLLGYDAWATAPICQLTPTAQSNTDSLGRLWGWEKQASCTFKDEQQQPLYPGSVPALQQWGAVAACPEAPTSQNSAADTAGRLWGVWYGRQVSDVRHRRSMLHPCRKTIARVCMHAGPPGWTWLQLCVGYACIQDGRCSLIHPRVASEPPCMRPWHIVCMFCWSHRLW